MKKIDIEKIDDEVKISYVKFILYGVAVLTIFVLGILTTLVLLYIEKLLGI